MGCARQDPLSVSVLLQHFLSSPGGLGWAQQCHLGGWHSKKESRTSGKEDHSCPKRRGRDLFPAGCKGVSGGAELKANGDSTSSSSQIHSLPFIHHTFGHLSVNLGCLCCDLRNYPEPTPCGCSGHSGIPWNLLGIGLEGPEVTHRDSKGKSMVPSARFL